MAYNIDTYLRYIVCTCSYETHDTGLGTVMICPSLSTEASHHVLTYFLVQISLFIYEFSLSTGDVVSFYIYL